MKIGIDLLWLRVGKVGGSESYIRNLMNGLSLLDTDHEYLLFVAADNYKSFKHYEENPKFRCVKCNTISESPLKRLLWENLFLDRYAKKNDVDLMFIPVYSKPWEFGNKIPYVTTIHDLQALHYPEYFSFSMNVFMKYIWWYACKTSKVVLTISKYVKDDIIQHYPFVKNKIEAVYIPIETQNSRCCIEELEKKYGIKKNKYLYCVSSLLPHKNLKTIIKMMSKMKQLGKTDKILISGVPGGDDAFHKLCKEYDVEDRVILTGFVPNDIRDALYENCEAFIFPSIFEGFGMPPIEALKKGKKVVTTRKTSIEEVTDGKAIYVDDPFDADEWIEKVAYAKKIDQEPIEFKQYDVLNIAKQYAALFDRVLAETKGVS